MAEKKRPSVSKKRRVAPPRERASSSSVPETPASSPVSWDGEDAGGVALAKASASEVASSPSPSFTPGSAPAPAPASTSENEPVPALASECVPAPAPDREPSFASEQNPAPETADATEDAGEAEHASNSRTRSAQPNKAPAQFAHKRRSVKKRRRWPKVVIAALVVLCAIVVGTFSWHRWLHGDDMADMLGVWYVPSGTTPITVEGDQIVLAEDVSYSYQLDTGAKTIEFSFGQMTGQGYYHFSLDRQTLVVQDGEYTWFDTLAEDASWVVRELAALVRGEGVPVPQGDNVLVLVREA